MIFQVSAKIFRDPNSQITMLDVWDFRANEVSQDGQRTLEFFESLEDLESVLWEHTKWTCQAILEFQDLQSIDFPHRGKWFNMNYLFFEGLSVLREGFLCGMNGQIHASLSVLRAALEILTTHYWWKHRGFLDRDYGQFYQWLRGEAKPIPFKKIIADTFHDMELPPGVPSEDAFKSIYAQLCSYAHKTIKREALTTIRGTNIPKPNHEQCVYWLQVAYATVGSLLYLMIGRNPICLFPVPQYRKFGFSPPVGAFFDESNHIPLCRALTKERVAELRLHYEGKRPPKSILDWFYEQPDMDNEAILATWDDQKDPIDDKGRSFEEKVLLRVAAMKANMRAIHYSFSYGEEGPELPDLDQFIKRLRL